MVNFLKVPYFLRVAIGMNGFRYSSGPTMCTRSGYPQTYISFNFLIKGALGGLKG